MSTASDQADRIAAMFRALGDPTRLRIFEFLRSCCSPVTVDDNGDVRNTRGPTAGEVCCSITGSGKISSTVSFHLKELRLAALITVERQGRHMVCSINQPRVAELTAYLAAADAADHQCDSSGDTPMAEPVLTDREDVRNVVRQRYGAAAKLVLEGRGQAASCCGPVEPGAASGSCCAPTTDKDPITSDLYSDTEAAEIPEDALLASLGCGNPTALAALNPGEVVLDLGSGGGIDVLLSAKRVGPMGFAYGLDMTDEMLAVAEKNRAEAGATNVKFLKGHIEEIPLPDATVDVIISNCVINLSGDKDRVLREAFRVLKPGGRFAVSDIVWRRPIPEDVRRNADLWAGCIAGALLETEYRRKLAAAGFRNVTVTPTRVYTAADAEGLLGSECCSSAEAQAIMSEADGAMMSAFIRAEKPAA